MVSRTGCWTFAGRLRSWPMLLINRTERTHLRSRAIGSKLPCCMVNCNTCTVFAVRVQLVYSVCGVLQVLRSCVTGTVLTVRALIIGLLDLSIRSEGGRYTWFVQPCGS